MYNRGSEIRIGERSLVDLVKLGEMEYDVIFGMNWLSSCHTQVDYHEKRTTFRMNGTPEFIYEGNQHRQNIPIISAIKATNLLRQGYQGYLGGVMDDKIIELEIEDVVVIREYPDIFFENLPRLLLDRKLEFSIKLLSRTAHISKAS